MGNENQRMSENICTEENSIHDINYQQLFKKYSPYKILGVSENESIENILVTYRKLLKKHHPDKGGDIKKFNLIYILYISWGCVRDGSPKGRDLGLGLRQLVKRPELLGDRLPLEDKDNQFKVCLCVLQRYI